MQARVINLASLAHFGWTGPGVALPLTADNYDEGLAYSKCPVL
jgi:hypothetical protein